MSRQNDDSLGSELLEAGVGNIPFTFGLLGPIAKRLMDAMRAEWKRNTSTALRAAEQVSGKSREDLAGEIAERPELVPLFTRLLYAAGMNGYDEVLQALGQALGDAIREPSKINDAETILVVLDGLNAEHIRVLRLVAADTEHKTPWSASVLAEHGVELHTAAICLSTLAARGLVLERQGWGGSPGVYDIAETGRLILDVIDEARRRGRPVGRKDGTDERADDGPEKSR